MCEKDLTCKDYYGDTITKGEVVALISNPKSLWEVLEINQVCDKRLLVLESSRGYDIKNNVDPKDYFIYSATRETCKMHAMQWVLEDMKTGKHVYTPYKDISGIPIAEGMILVSAFDDESHRKYYVTKNEETKEYYLQCFFDVNIFDDSVFELTEDIAKASEYLDIAVRANGIPMFKEDYDIKM